jgi:membrane protein
MSPRKQEKPPTAAGQEPGRGRRARKPSDIPAPGWRDILRRTFQQLSEDNLSIVAAGMAFYAFTAMVPALAATIAIYALVNDPSTVAGHIETIVHVLPEQTRPLLHEQLARLTADNRSAGWGAALGVGIALFGAMKAMTALMTGLNIAYGEQERRGFVRQYLVALLLTLSAIAGTLLLFGLLAVLPALLRWLRVDELAQTLFSALRWPLLAGLFTVGLAACYRYAPCRERARWRWITWGAASSTVLWLLGSAVFSYYLSKFGDYEGTYGSLGAVVAFLMWLFLTSYAILLGAELDAEMERQTLEDTTDGPAEPMGARGAKAADTLGPSGPASRPA